MSESEERLPTVVRTERGLSINFEPVDLQREPLPVRLTGIPFQVRANLGLVAQVRPQGRRKGRPLGSSYG